MSITTSYLSEDARRAVRHIKERTEFLNTVIVSGSLKDHAEYREKCAEMRAYEDVLDVLLSPESNSEQESE
jgi:hypothetical protein